MRDWKAHRGRCRGLAYSPDGSVLATCGEDNALRLWDALTLRPTRDVDLRERGSGVAFSPCGRFLAVQGVRDLLVWRRGPGGWHGPERVAHAVPVFVGGGSVLVTYGRDGQVAGLDLTATPAAAVPLSVSVPSAFQATFVSACPSGLRLAVLRAERAAVRDADGTQVGAWELPLFGWRCTAMALGPDGRRLAVGTVRGDLYRLTAGQSAAPVARLSDHEVAHLAWHPDGRRLLACPAGRPLVLWDSDEWRESARFDWGIRSARAAAFHPDGLTAAAAGDRGRVVVWDLDS